MPVEIDERWEYWEPDPEIAEVLALSGAVCRRDIESLGIELRNGQTLTDVGFRRGSGDPDRITFRLAPERQRCRSERHEWRECVTCGVAFRADRSDRRYCSLACRPVGRRRSLPDVLCKQCQRTFRPWFAGQVFCSPECVGLSQRRQPITGGGCRNCGGAIPPSESRNRSVQRVFCAERCKRNWANRAMRARRRMM